MISPEVVIFPDAAAVAEAAARRWLDIARNVMARGEVFTVALAGGSTPETLYRLLSQPTYRDEMDWARTQVFFGDERCLSPDDPRSNYHMAWETLLRHVPIPDASIFRVRGELPGPQAAADYEDALRCAFALSAGSLPRFDLILLGLGADGHTASLFPGMPALEASEALGVFSGVPGYVKPQLDRITLTFPVLNAASHIMYLATGEAKAIAVRDALAGPGAAHPSPAGLVQPVDGSLTWLLDAGAASLIAAPGEGVAHG